MNFLKWFVSPLASEDTPLTFYNSLGKEKQDFKLPPPASQVRMYNCGPTVYDRQHIGNLSAAIFADTIRRTLEYNGFAVKQVINITDFGHLVSDADDGEDKMTKGLKREKLKPTMENMREFATKYMNLYLEDIKALNVAVDKITFPRASDYVSTMIAMIQTLEEKGYAYKIADGVYFDTEQFSGYGILGGVNSNDVSDENRVAINTYKRNPHDFALWKNSAKGKQALGWESPWGQGFPGWHLECSAMINNILGKQIDIHTGGIEHVSIHHNNEIAQSEAVTGKKPLSRFWMHREHIRLRDAKLAKSTGNTAYLSDVITKGFHPLALRYWFLTAHYRQHSNFTWEALAGAQQAFIRLHQKMHALRAESTVSSPARFSTTFRQHINDDLDTAGALASLWEALKGTGYSPAEMKAMLLEADSVFAIGLTMPSAEIVALINVSEAVSQDEIPEKVKVLLAERESARDNKDWKKADQFRIDIETEGYIVKDTPEGAVLLRKTNPIEDTGLA